MYTCPQTPTSAVPSPGPECVKPKKKPFSNRRSPTALEPILFEEYECTCPQEPLLSGFWMHGLVPGNALKLMGELKIRSVSLFRHHLDVIASVNVIVIHKNEAMKPIEIL